MAKAKIDPKLIEACKKELAMNFELSASAIIGSYANRAGVSFKTFEKAIHGE